MHNRIDAEVTAAYGWPAGLSDEDILTRLVALNRQRAEEEKSGRIRWLRPDYQIPRAKTRTPLARDEQEQVEAELVTPAAPAPALPKDDEAMIAALRGVLQSLGRPADIRTIAQKFSNASRSTQRIERGLRILAAAGVARRAEGGWFIPGERR